MTDIASALDWKGTGPEILTFVVHRGVDLSDLDGDVEVFRYELEDDEGALPGLQVTELDVSLTSLPLDLDSWLVTWLWSIGRREHVVGLWTAFEGSFSFDHLLTPDIADQVYGLCVPPTRPIVETSDLTTHRWVALVADARARIVPGTGSPEAVDR